MYKVLVLSSVLLLSSCTTKIEDYRKSSPNFDLESFFNGEMVAWGIVQDYTQKVTRKFCVNISSRWFDDNGVRKGIIDEEFFFDDGEQSERSWKLERINGSNTNYLGTANDVIGTAHGQAVGSAFNLKYTLEIPLKKSDGSYKTMRFSVDDWMYKMDNQRVFNRSSLNKFGLKVGEVVLFFDKTQKAKCDEFTQTER